MTDSVEDFSQALSNPLFGVFLNTPIDDPYWNVRARPYKTYAGGKRTTIGRLLTEEEQDYLYNSMICFAPWTIDYEKNILWRYEIYE